MFHIFGSLVYNQNLFMKKMENQIIIEMNGGWDNVTWVIKKV